MAILKNKLEWLRFFVLDSEGIGSDDTYRPLNDILYRHQQLTEDGSQKSKEQSP
jgi:hypothetical protein